MVDFSKSSDEIRDTLHERRDTSDERRDDASFRFGIELAKSLEKCHTAMVAVEKSVPEIKPLVEQMRKELSDLMVASGCSVLTAFLIYLKAFMEAGQLDEARTAILAAAAYELYTPREESILSNKVGLKKTQSSLN